MAEEPDNLTLQILRRLDQKLERIEGDSHGMMVCMTAVEEGLAGINRRLDRMDERLPRIERRFDLVESPR